MRSINVGDIFWSLCKFYDVKMHRMSIKKRPVLIIGVSDDTEFTVLPISRVTKREYVSAEYDVEILLTEYPNLRLRADSYIRSHKAYTVHLQELDDFVSSVKIEYEETYLDVMTRYEIFQE